MTDTNPAREYLGHLSTMHYDVTWLTPNSNGTISRREASVLNPRLPVLELASNSDAELRLKGVLGEGGMGRVLAAEQSAIGRDVAVKVALQDVSMSAEVLREALITGRLEHPNIVPVYLLGRSPQGEPLFVMRRIVGVAWSEVLHDASAAPGVFAEKLLRDRLGFQLNVFEQVCEAMQFAHAQGILHRDLKPANVMLGAYGEIYVVDWGIAVTMREDPVLPRASEVRSIAGTPAYMAPEMASMNAGALSERTDVYLLGAILHEVLTGHPPHEGASVLLQLAHAFESPAPNFGPEVPGELAGICRKAMSATPSERYASVNELRKAVRDFGEHRHAWVLSNEAERSARALGELLAKPSEERSWSARVHELFSEARFGFRQALVAWEGNEGARAGLRSLLETMVNYELGRDNPLSAAELLAQLTEPREELRERVESAVKAAEGRSARLRELEHRRRDDDASLGSEVRAQLLLGMGVAWLAAGLGSGHLTRVGMLDASVGNAFLAALVHAVLVFGASAALFFSKRANAAQRRILMIATFAAVCFALHFAVSLAGGTTLVSALATLLFWAGVGWVVTGISMDRTLVAGGCIFGLGAIPMMYAGRYMIEVFGFVVFCAYTCVWAQLKVFPPEWSEAKTSLESVGA